MRNTILNKKFMYSYWNVTGILIVINFVVFCLTGFLMPRLTYYLALIPSRILYRHWYWQFFTYMFVHGNVSHFLFNMLSLYIFGTQVERRIGSKEFLLYYLFIGTLCGLASYGCYYLANTNTVLLGSSGAIYALLAMFSVLYPRAVIYIFGLLPVRAPILILIYFIISLLGGIGGYGNSAYFTHLFGLIFGLLYIVIRMRINPLDAWRYG